MSHLKRRQSILQHGPSRRARPLGSFVLISLGLTLGGGLLFWPTDSQAQFGPGGGMRPMGGQPGGMGGQGGGMGGMGGGPPPDKPEGPAEQAPGVTTGDAAIEPLPEWRDKKEKSIQFLQLNGYLRGRGFYWHNFNLGHFNDPSVRANPFTAPYSEIPTGQGAMAMQQASSCSSNERTANPECRERGIRTADMRFRLEPTLNLSEQIRIKSQIDIFDNLVLGSTPEGFYINGRGGAADGYPTLNSRGQVPQESVVNALQSSIRAKRAWGEIKIPLVEIGFGRMPFHWGTGMLFNDGNCNDCDFGTTVDRIMVTARNWNHFVSLSYDWAATGPNSAIVRNQQLIGWNYNLDNVDDVNQYTLAFGRRDDDVTIADKLKHGKVVFNYGALLMARHQDWDLTYNPRPQVTEADAMGQDTSGLVSLNDLQKSLGKRSAWSITADVWARLQFKKLYLEVEGAGIFGNIGELGVYGNTGAAASTPIRATLGLQQLGGILRGNYRFLKDALIVGLEVGSGSGPQNGDPRGELNYRLARESPNGPLDTTTGMLQLRNSRFTFDPDHHVDMILFRRILGTVYNATYMKPNIAYWIIDSFGGQAEFIYSMANRPATFPGHAVNLGAEINLRLMYRNLEEGFFATLEYGVLFDLGGLTQKPDIWADSRKVDATIAQAFQAKVMLKF
jgi:uncharacterized protein (TIGR04551 family)